MDPGFDLSSLHSTSHRVECPPGVCMTEEFMCLSFISSKFCIKSPWPFHIRPGIPIGPKGPDYALTKKLDVDMQGLFYLMIPLYCSSPISSVSIFLHIPMSFLPVFFSSALSTTRQQTCLSLNERACKWREWFVTERWWLRQKTFVFILPALGFTVPQTSWDWRVCIRCGFRSSEGAGKVNKTNSKVCAILKKLPS